MSIKAKAFVGFIITAGIACFAFCVYRYVQSYASANDLRLELITLGVLMLLCIACHSLPVKLDKQIQLDISTIIVLSAVLLKGPYFASIVAFVGFLLRFVHSDGKWICLFTVPLHKTLFNSAILILATFFAGFAVHFITGMSWDGGIPDRYLAIDVILPALVFVFVYYIINMFSMGILFLLLRDMIAFRNLLFNTWGLILTNFLATAPLGYFIMRLMLIREDTIVLMALFCIPLFLTRFTFKMNMEARERYFQTISMLMTAIEARDVYTEGHSRRVEMYAAKLAEELGFSTSRINNIKVAATLHDVGKIGIVDAILRKPGPLSPEERQTIQCHPNIALHILKGVQFNPIVIDAIRHHHERYDGTGYPDGLRGSQISIEACILGVVDVYDAMTTDRPYRKAIPQDQVIEMMLKESGKHFNPKVMEPFVRMIAALPAEGEVK